MADINFQYFAQLVARHSIARGLCCSNVGKTTHKVLSLFDVVVGWLDRMVVKKLGELVEDRVVYLDWRGNGEELWVRWQSSVMNDLIFKSLAFSAILGLGTGGWRFAWVESIFSSSSL